MPPWLTSSAVMWIGIVLIVLIGNYFGYARRASRDRMLEKLAEHGQSLPPSLAAEMQCGGDHARYYQSYSIAFILMGIGIALALFFWAMTGGNGLFPAQPGVPLWLPMVGIFPFIIGLSRLLGQLFDRRRPK